MYVYGNLQTVKLDAEPAFVLRVGPRVNDRDARHREFVRLDLGKFIDADRFQTEIGDCRFEQLPQVPGVSLPA